MGTVDITQARKLLEMPVKTAPSIISKSGVVHNLESCHFGLLSRLSALKTFDTDRG
jgi:hypothetical protein